MLTRLNYYHVVYSIGVRTCRCSPCKIWCHCVFGEYPERLITMLRVVLRQPQLCGPQNLFQLEGFGGAIQVVT
jgi:hypothetical protein